MDQMISLLTDYNMVREVNVAHTNPYSNRFKYLHSDLII